LELEFQFTRLLKLANISPVKLPQISDGATTFEGSEATVSGFEQTQQGGY